MACGVSACSRIHSSYMYVFVHAHMYAYLTSTCMLCSLAAQTSTSIAGTDQRWAAGVGGGGGSSYNRPSSQRPYQQLKSPTPRHAVAPGYLRTDDNERGVGGGGATRSAWSIGRGLGGLATWMGGCFGCIGSEREEYVTRENFAVTCDEFEALLPSGVLIFVGLL